MNFFVATSLLAMMATKVDSASSKATCRVNPDPHFFTFDGIYYDYHGGCDLVLIQNPVFDGADMLDLHIRTVPFNGWGGISNAVLQIGGNKLEVVDNGDTYLDGTLLVSPTSGTLGVMGTMGYDITYSVTGSQQVWEVALNSDQYIRIMNYNYGGSPPFAGSISIEVYADHDEFNSSVGMCGTWVTPGLIARDGSTDFQSLPPAPTAGVMMGQEWQVLASEAQLFQFYTGVTPPVVLPSQACGVGHVGGPHGDGADRDKAEEACEHLDGEEFNNCVFDVMTTGNTIWAKAPFYFKYQCAPKGNFCKKKGGRCMERKECDRKTHFCNRKLCYAKYVPIWLHELDHVAANVTRRLTGEGRELAVQIEDDNQNYVDIMHRNTQVDDVIEGPALSDFRDPCVCAIPKKFQSGKCCKYTGPIPFNCAAIDALTGPGVDFDGRCNAVHKGASCAWDYSDPDCCKIAMNDAICKLPSDEAEESCKCALDKLSTADSALSLRH